MAENILENTKFSTLELKSMISNAIRFHRDINHNIMEHTLYELSLKFVIDNKNSVTINDIAISKVVDDPSIVESLMEEKCNEYDSLMKEMNDDLRSKGLKGKFQKLFQEQPKTIIKREIKLHHD